MFILEGEKMGSDIIYGLGNKPVSFIPNFRLSLKKKRFQWSKMHILSCRLEFSKNSEIQHFVPNR